MTFFVDAEIVVWCESIQRGCTFSARITDGANARWYAGQGATAFEAIAWALHELVARGVLDHDPSLARNADARPGDGLVAAPSSRTRRVTPAPASFTPARDHDTAKDEIACFERSIPASPAPRLFNDTPPTTTTRPRRARGGRS